VGVSLLYLMGPVARRAFGFKIPCFNYAGQYYGCMSALAHVLTLGSDHSGEPSERRTKKRLPAVTQMSTPPGPTVEISMLWELWLDRFKFYAQLYVHDVAGYSSVDYL
jgi:hypothetical protein